MSYKVTHVLYEGPSSASLIDVPDLSAFDRVVIYGELITVPPGGNGSASCNLFELIPGSGDRVRVAAAPVRYDARVGRDALPVMYGARYAAQVAAGSGGQSGHVFRMTLVASTAC